MHAYRPDIADIALAGQLFAPHYARPMIRAISSVSVDLVSGPSVDAEILAELQAGDEFAVLDVSGGWAWGYGRKDHRVGYVPIHSLTGSLVE